MGGFLRFVAFFALLVAGFVLVALPLLMGPLLAGVVRDMGLRADRIEVSVALFDPGLFVGRSRQVTLNATNVDMGQGRIGSLQLTLGDVAFFDRTFDTASGDLQDVQLTLGENTVSAASATIDGPADAATVTARFTAAQVARLLTVAAAHNGLTLDKVTVTDSGVQVRVHGVEAGAQLSVRGGALLLDPGIGGALVLIQPAARDPWRLTDVWFSANGMNLAGTVDVAQIVADLSGGGG
ncbi:MAG: hypothetical protein QFC55_07855 [Chloroflexota bacterium]|nr:hypothetical protein [Chloroflexota bacterium]